MPLCSYTQLTLFSNRNKNPTELGLESKTGNFSSVLTAMTSPWKEWATTSRNLIQEDYEKSTSEKTRTTARFMFRLSAYRWDVFPSSKSVSKEKFLHGSWGFASLDSPFHSFTELGCRSSGCASLFFCGLFRELKWDVDAVFVLLLVLYTQLVQFMLDQTHSGHNCQKFQLS